jgi:hypothetical protein
MNRKSIPLSLLDIGAESRDSTLRAVAVFESWGRLRLGERCRDLNGLVEVGGDDVFLLGGGTTAMFDLLLMDSAQFWTSREKCHTNESDLHPRPFGLKPPTLTDFHAIALVSGL